MKKVNSSTSSLSKELRGVNSLLKLDPKNTELVSQKQTILKQNIEQTSKKLEELRKAQEMADSTIANGGEISQENYRNLQREIINTESKLKQLQVEASKWTTAGRSIEEFGNKVSNISNKIDKMGTTLTTRLTLPIAGMVTTAITSMDAVDEGLDTIATKTGATGAAAKELQEIFKEVASEVPGEFGDIGAAVGEINTRLDFTGDKLKTASVEFLKFAKVNGTDVNTSVQLVTRAMGDAGIKADDYASLLDMLTVAGQKSGISIDALTTNLAKYGAPMRALGIDTKNAIAMFAGWEKAGVNTEIAFSGMKKAISNWGAAGKDSTKEFSKTLNEIAKCPDIAKATTKAIKVFGAKAGPDLADAIKGGRFEFEKYVEALDSGSGTIESTYKQIVDEVDDTQLAMQNAKIAMHDAGEIAAKSLGPALLDLSKKFKSLMERFDKLSDKEKKQILNITLTVAAIGPCIKIIGTLGKTIGTGIKTVGTFSQAISLMGKTSTDAFRSASSGTQILAKGLTGLASPAGIMTLALAATTATVTALTFEMTKQLRAYEEEGKELDNVILKHQEFVNQQNETMNSSLAEADNVEKLSGELRTLVDENGKVKKGYEDRVSVILNELNEAFGIETKMTDGVIDKYKELESQIDELILKKKANAILENDEAKYNEAINNKTEAYNDMLQKEKELAEAREKTAEATKKYQENEWDTSAARRTMYAAEKKAAEEAEKVAEENYNKSKKLHSGYLDYIAIHENDAAIVLSGNNEKIQEMITRRSYTYKQTSNDIGETINHNIQQVQYEVQQYQLAREEDLRNQDTMNAIKNQTQIEAGKQQILNLANQLKAMTSTTEELTPQQEEAWKNMAIGSYDIYSEVVSGMDEPLRKKIQDMTGVIVVGTPEMQEKSRQLGEKTVQEFDKSAEAKTKALNTMTGYLNGLSDENKRELLKQAGIENVDAVIQELDKGNLSEQNGKNILEGLWKGLSNGTWKGKILGVASGLAQSVNKAFTGKDGWDEHSPSKKMKKFAEYYIQPITDVMENRKRVIVSTAQELANKVNSAFNNQMNIPKVQDFGKFQGSLRNKIVDSTKTVFTTPQIVFNVQELDESKLQQCFNYINKKFGSAY